ncbi:UNVERIFIED_ORG: hypothetical protein QOE_3616 [Clostridioides difficile F501]
MLAQNHRSRVRGQHACDEKDDDCHTQQNGNHHEDSFEDVFEQLLLLSLPGSVRAACRRRANRNEAGGSAFGFERASGFARTCSRGSKKIA